MTRSKSSRRTLLATALAVALVACTVALVACSSAPKTPDAEVAVKNQASEYTTFGNSYFAQADYEMALRFFELALQENHSIDNLPGIAKSHNSIGKVYAAVGRYAVAADNYRLAGSFAEIADDKEQLALALINRGELALLVGDDAGASARFDEAQQMVDNEEVPESPILFHNLGTMYARQGDLSQARQNLERARAINEADGDWTELASNYYMLSSLASRESNYDEAFRLATLALEYDKRAENSPGIGTDLAALGRISERRERLEDAYQYYLRALRVYLTLDLVPQTIDTLERLTRVAEETGRESEAVEFAAQRERIVEALAPEAEDES